MSLSLSVTDSTLKSYLKSLISLKSIQVWFTCALSWRAMIILGSSRSKGALEKALPFLTIRKTRKLSCKMLKVTPSRTFTCKVMVVLTLIISLMKMRRSLGTSTSLKKISETNSNHRRRASPSCQKHSMRVAAHSIWNSISEKIDLSQYSWLSEANRYVMARSTRLKLLHSIFHQLLLKLKSVTTPSRIESQLSSIHLLTRVIRSLVTKTSRR